ncbi:MAG: thiamine pyrophosphate-dependent dehydrogenase E1 component subunit alpha [Trebonia sp.]
MDQQVMDELGVPGLLEMYRRMVAIRVFDTTVEGLIDRGELVGSIHTSIGQEGSCAGAGMAVKIGDYMTGSHRSHGHPIGKGAELAKLMAELFGKDTGVCHGNGGSMHLADFGVGSLGETAIVASSLPIAVGAALASKIKGENKVVLAFFGDGASNAGAFHESLNLAAVWKLPVIFMCENNQFAVSTRHESVCSVEHISERGPAYRMRAETVDGQDALAVWTAVREAARIARSGGGPSLVEALTYRYGDHSYLMNRLKYRTKEEVDIWRQNDPIDNLGGQLVAEELATEEKLAEVRQSVADEIEQSLKFARDSAYPTADSLWPNMYTDQSGFAARRHNQAWFDQLEPAK